MSPSDDVLLHPISGVAAPPVRGTRADDRKLVRAIRGGSEAAWGEFIERYSGLVLAVIRRHLHSRDEDDVRNLYVDVLTKLYRGQLAKFEGRSSLSSWLILVTRNLVMDFLRKRFGRRQLPGGIEALDARDHRVFHLYHEQGLGLREVRQVLGAGGEEVGAEELAEALGRIESRLDRKVKRRCAYDIEAHAVGLASGRLLEFLDLMKLETEERRHRLRPDTLLIEQEARRLGEYVMELVGRLPKEERRIVELWFGEERRASDIARVLNLSGQRKVYTLVARAVRMLRRQIEAGGRGLWESW